MEATFSTVDHVLTPGNLLDSWKAKSELNSVLGYARALEGELERVKTEGASIFTIDLVTRLHERVLSLEPKFTSGENTREFTDGVSREIPSLPFRLYRRGKNQYSQVLQEAQKKLRYGPIIEFFAQTILESHRDASETRRKLEVLPSHWLERGRFRKDSTAERSLPWIIGHPIFTVKQLQQKLLVSPQAAHVAVELLKKYRIVRERTGFKRNRVFAAEEVISLLSRPFGSDPNESLESERIRS